MKRLLKHLLIWTVRASATIPLAWLFLFLHSQPEGSGGISDALFNGVMLTGWSVLHSLTARDFFKQRISRFVGQEPVRALYVIVSGMTLVPVLYYWKPLSGVLWSVYGTGYWILTILFIGCIGGSFFVARYFDAAEFIGIRGYLRKLQNKPARPQEFSADGPYAYCRHPIYIFLIASLWVGPTMTYGRFEFALLGTLYIVIGTFFEERNLRAELGEEYEIYRANVPMWIPRLRPWRPRHARDAAMGADILPNAGSE
jgi:protein-S-isoprenylcysteine O-methyltransferase Ste14